MAILDYHCSFAGLATSGWTGWTIKRQRSCLAVAKYFMYQSVNSWRWPHWLVEGSRESRDAQNRAPPGDPESPGNPRSHSDRDQFPQSMMRFWPAPHRNKNWSRQKWGRPGFKHICLYRTCKYQECFSLRHFETLVSIMEWQDASCSKRTARYLPISWNRALVLVSLDLQTSADMMNTWAPINWNVVETCKHSPFKT